MITFEAYLVRLRMPRTCLRCREYPSRARVHLMSMEEWHDWQVWGRCTNQLLKYTGYQHLLQRYCRYIRHFWSSPLQKKKTKIKLLKNVVHTHRCTRRGGGGGAEQVPNHYEPPGQNCSIVSQICLIFVSNCFKRSQFCLKHVSDKMSQFGLNLRPFWHLRHNWDCPSLRAIWEQFETFSALSKRCQKGLKHVSKRDLGDLVDRWWIDGLFRYLVFKFKLYDFTIRIVWYNTIASYYLLVTCNQLYCIICLHS